MLKFDGNSTRWALKQSISLAIGGDTIIFWKSSLEGQDVISYNYFTLTKVLSLTAILSLRFVIFRQDDDDDDAW